MNLYLDLHFAESFDPANFFYVHLINALRSGSKARVQEAFVKSYIPREEGNREQ